MNPIAENIKQRLSLRQPLQQSLDILSHLAGELELKKEVDLKTELEKAKTLTAEEWDVMPYYTDQHRIHFPGDDTISNYGIYEGRLVKIDYASLDKNWGEDFKPDSL